MATVDELATLMPATAEISDDKLRKAILTTWAEAWESSPYTSLDDAPQGRHTPNRSLLSHVNEVNTWALNLIHYARDRFGLEPDANVTLAAAILHDVDKPLIYVRDAAGCRYADGRSHEDHGPVGAELALKHGVPQEIATLVRDHSPFSKNGLPGTVEGTILHYADLTAADLAHVEYGTEPIHERVRMEYKTDHS